MKRIVICLAAFLLAYLGYVFLLPHSYSVDKAVAYLNAHAEPRSRNMCALYVERAISAGGQPAFIVPAWGYAYVLPHMGFDEVGRDCYVPQKGDVVVFPHVKNHIWGHIAMYNGHQWVSDFKQRGMIVAKEYNRSQCQYFRHKN
ncbi:MAG: CHAP domain-containing protein [Muribaculaceae bacterium]|nr:CHAP domain-containing protein [Muribaculaceae bacterium]